jgi:hypothetical protein
VGNGQYTVNSGQCTAGQWKVVCKQWAFSVNCGRWAVSDVQQMVNSGQGISGQ